MGSTGYSDSWPTSARESYSNHSYRYHSFSNTVVQGINELKQEIESQEKKEPKQEKESKQEIDENHDKDTREIVKDGKKDFTIERLIREYKRITKETDFRELSEKYVGLFKLIKIILNTMKKNHMDKRSEFNYSEDEIELLMDIDKYGKMISSIMRAFEDITEGPLNDENEIRKDNVDGNIIDYIDYTL